MPTNIFSLPTEINASLTIGGTDNVAVTSTGNVGIGTTSPTQKLDVVGNIAAQYDANNYSRLGSSSSGGYIQSYSGGAEKIMLRSYGDSFFNAGNVGIGTTSPSYKLDVDGTAGISGKLTMLVGTETIPITISGSSHKYIDIATSTNNQVGIRMSDDNVNFIVGLHGGEDSFKISGHTSFGTNDYLTVLDTGKVGIGNTSPTANLDVVSSSGSAIVGKFSTSGTTAYLSLADTNTTSFLGLSATTNDLKFWTQNSARVTIDSSGNVGIGTTSISNAKLKVAGGGVDIESSTDSLRLRFYNGTTFQSGFQAVLNTGEMISGAVSGDMAIRSQSNMLFAAGGNTERMRITSSGNVGIGVVPKTGGSTWQHIQFGGTGNIIARKSDSTVDAMFANNYYINSSNVDSHIITGAATRMFLNDGEIRFDTAPSAAADAAATFTNRMFIANGGNVGIGTTSPSAKLEVVGDTYLRTQLFTDTIRPYSADQLTLLNGGNNYLYVNGNVGIGVTNPWTKLVLDGDPQAGTANAGVALAFDGTDHAEYGYRFKANGANYYQVLYDGSAINWKNYAGGASYTTRMSLTNGGNLGIGTTSPSSMLEIRKATATHQLVSLNRPGSDVAAMYLGNDSSSPANGVIASNYSDLILGRDQSGTLTEHVRIKRDGNVGIGTTSPGAKLEVAGAVKVTDSASGITIGGVGHASLRLNRASTSYDNNILFNTNGDTKFRIWQDGNADYLYIRDDDNATNMVTFKKGGNVGIGTTNPSTGLDVRTSFYSNTTARFGESRPVYIINQDPIIGFNAYYDSGWKHGTSGHAAYIGASGGNGHIYFYTGDGTSRAANANMVANERMRIQPNGNVGIGTTSPSEKLQVAGNVKLTGSIMDIRFIESDTTDVNSLIRHQTGLLRFDTISDDEATITTRVALKHSSGHLGIGNINPSARVHITGTATGHELLRLEGGAADANPYISFYQTSTRRSFIQHNDGNNNLIIASEYGLISFKTASDGNETEKMRIQADGNIGIGTTSPSKKLDVRGEVALDIMPGHEQAGAIRIGRSDGTSRYHEIVAYNSSTTANNYVRFDVHNGTVGSNIGVLTLRGNGNVQFPQYGAGYLKTDADGNITVDSDTIEDTLDSVTDRGNTTTNDIEVGNITTKNDSGIYSFSDTVNASASEDIFSISNQHGSQAFRVTFVCSTSGYSVAKTFEVVHSYGNDPVFFKVVDTGDFSGHDFDVSFTNSNTDTGVTCEITNNSTNKNADIVTTVFLGGSPTAITVTAL